MAVKLICNKCNKEKEESLFVFIKGARVGKVCRLCRNEQIVFARKNKKQIEERKIKLKYLCDNNLAVCSKCNILKKDSEYPQQFGKRWGLICSDCTRTFKKTLYLKSEKYIAAQKRKDEIQKNKEKKEIEKKQRIYIRSIALLPNSETICRICKIKKHNSDFPKNKKGFRHGKECLKCVAKRTMNYTLNIKKNNYKLYLEERKYSTAKRRSKLYQRTPKWADMKNIRQIYSNCPEGYHVDHIIPLRGKLVSGLHVENNLQYLSAFDNFKKNNRYNID